MMVSFFDFCIFLSGPRFLSTHERVQNGSFTKADGRCSGGFRYISSRGWEYPQTTLKYVCLGSQKKYGIPVTLLIPARASPIQGLLCYFAGASTRRLCTGD